jgi:hypothetical protein
MGEEDGGKGKSTHQAFSPSTISSLRKCSIQSVRGMTGLYEDGGGIERESVCRGEKVVEVCEHDKHSIRFRSWPAKCKFCQQVRVEVDVAAGERSLKEIDDNRVLLLPIRRPLFISGQSFR